MKQFSNLDAQVNMRLMQGRLGQYDFSQNISKSVDGIQDMSQRLLKDGGILQQDRMIRDKYRSFREALKYSYQGAYVKKYYPDYIETMDGVREAPPVRALINSNKLKMDYDDKIISIDFEHNFKVGDIFKWENTGTYWLIYLQDLTELAYFRGDIRKCTYEIKWQEDGKTYSSFAAIRGPVETKINFIQKHGISIDTPNHSLNILMPKTEYTLKQFQRYSKFYLQDIGTEESRVCWRVEATDSISVPGILEITAVEYYANETEDDIDNGVVGGLIVEPLDPNPEEIKGIILGETFIKPKKFYEFTFSGTENDKWFIDKKYPVETQVNGKKIQIKWLSNFSGQFDLYYGDNYKKTIVIESLF